MQRDEVAPHAFRIGLAPARAVAAWLALAAVLALLAVGIAPRPAAPSPAASAPRDAVLYRHIVQDLRRGEPYYAAAAREQRAAGYPLRPFVAVRPPLLAKAMAALPGDGARRLALAALGVAVLATWVARLAESGVSLPRFGGALVLLCSGVGVAFAPAAWPFHEVWAGLLIALSLALRQPGRWGASLAVGLAAALTRELAAAYLLAMAALALKDGARGEALGWLGALAAAGVALAAHAWLVAGVLRPGDMASPGWLAAGGWPFVLSALRWNAALLFAPTWVGAILAPFALLGLAAWRGPLGQRVALTVFGYLAAFMLIGRPDNHYWGLLLAPLWPLGLALLPDAVRLGRQFVFPPPRASAEPTDGTI